MNDLRAFPPPAAARQNIKGTGAVGTSVTQIPTALPDAAAPSGSEATEGEAVGFKTTESPLEATDKVIQEYIAFLRENDFDEEDIFSVLDLFLTDGEVTWEFKLFDKFSVKFRSRPAWMPPYVLRLMEADPPQSMMRYQDTINGYNLAGSLVHFGGKDLSVGTEEELSVNHVFVRKFSFPIFAALVRKLLVFDRLVAVATSDWAIENFMKRQPAVHERR